MAWAGVKKKKKRIQCLIKRLYTNSNLIRKPFQTSVLYEYMQFFVFTDMRLDSAFRKLCSKLYFKAEAQQIDRILESFANRYWDCNPNSLFGSAGMHIKHAF
jgi:Sec7-like guanine-nucleotide exchange factor